MQDVNEKGFALYDEVAEVVRDDLGNGNDLHDLFAGIDSTAVELLDEPMEFEKKDEEAEELTEVDLSAGSLDKSNDSVRVYLREMGMVPLLTREGEIELAKQIERGEAAVRKALSRSRLIVHLLFEARHNIERGALSILDVLQAPDPQISREDEHAVRLLRQQFLEAMQDIEKLYRKAQHTEQKLISTSRNLKTKQFRKLRFEHARLMVCVSRQIRAIPFSVSFQRSLSKGLRRVVDQLRPAEQQIARLQRRLEQPAIVD
jgi:RNA polymerase primary sigma factor